LKFPWHISQVSDGTIAGVFMAGTAIFRGKTALTLMNQTTGALTRGGGGVDPFLSSGYSQSSASRTGGLRSNRTDTLLLCPPPIDLTDRCVDCQTGIVQKEGILRRL